MKKNYNCFKYESFLFHIRIHILLFSGLFFIPFIAKSQISPLYSKHYNYEQFINPAITGRDKSPIVNLSHKQYFFGAKGTPNSTTLGASIRLGTFDFYNPQKMLNRTGFFSRGRMGLGFMFMQDKDGPLNTYFAEFSYGYFIPLKNKNSELSFGLSAQFLDYHLNRSILDLIDYDDPLINNPNISKIVPESGCGIYYHDLQFYAGASINDLLLTKQPLNRNNFAVNKRDYFFQTGYKLFLKRFEMEPSVYLAKIDSDPLYYFSQLKFYYKNYNWIALGYRSTKALLFSLGISLHRFYVAYAFEQNISGMSSYFSGSHEIMLGMNIGLYEPLGIIKRSGKR